jgi:hypothetical protein
MEAAITKRPYLSPEAEIVKICNEGIICVSGLPGRDFDDSTIYDGGEF